MGSTRWLEELLEGLERHAVWDLLWIVGESHDPRRAGEHVGVIVSWLEEMTPGLVFPAHALHGPSCTYQARKMSGTIIVAAATHTPVVGVGVLKALDLLPSA